jgi:hypothetical protein
MTASISMPPLAYRPEFEQAEPGEEETIRSLIATMRSINETTSKDYGRAVRASFAKSFALLDAELTVLPGLPDALRQGVFAAEKRYKAIIRMATAPGDLLPDAISTARSFAIKLSDVEGERLPGAESETAQDFILINSPKFLTSSLKKLSINLAAFAATTDKAEGLKKAASLLMQGAEAALEAVGGESVNLKHGGGQLPVHPLGDNYHTMAPILFGPYMAKLRVRPVGDMAGLGGQKIDLSSQRPDALREEMLSYCRSRACEWMLEAQLCRDIEKMPIENSAVEWPEEASPFLPVATIHAAPQTAWSEEKSRRIDDCLCFNPWQGIAAHRPIGAIMRARRAVYPTSAEFRGAFNGCPVHGPAKTADAA